MTLIIVLLLIATTLIVAEVMFPSFGILGLLAATAFLVAILEAFKISTETGYMAIVGTGLLVPFALWLGFTLLKHTSLGNRLLLAGPKHEEVRGQGTDRKLAELIGAEGRAITPLGPSGVVLFGDREVDAVSDGGWIDRDRVVHVLHVEGNRVVVEETTAN